jgi:two-component system, sensor histidine kinase and response regulator
MIFKTIKGNLIFFITILLGLISLFIFFYFPSQFENIEADSLREKASLLNKMGAYSLSPALNFNDPDNIKEAGSGIVLNRDIMYVIIEDESGVIKFYHNQSLAYNNNYKTINDKPEPGKNLIYKTMEKVVYRNNVVGNIYVGYSLAPIRQAMFINRLIIALISIFIFILATFLVNIISRFSLMPLTGITNTARNISHENLDTRAKESFGEIGELAAAFNIMLEKLQKSRAELEGWNRNLEDIVQQRTSELTVAKDKAEEMNRVKSIFFANMSHELRTPLIGIIGFTEILLAELTNPDHIEMINLIYKSGQRLGVTLNQILEISKIESNKMNLELKPHDITDITENAMKIFKSAAILKNLQLLSVHNAKNCIALVDEHHFVTILENLINNAIKFTKTGRITVETGLEISGTHKWAYCQVSDTGIGISHEKIETIFLEFRQVSEGNNRQYEGTGLGLTITKKLTEMMKGTISVQSEPGSGSVFTVKFPAYTS